MEFFQSAHERAKAVGKFEMWQQSETRYTWNTMVAASYWEMRLGVVCTATDAEYQNRIIWRDRTLDFPVVVQHPALTPILLPIMRRIRWQAAVSVPEGTSLIEMEFGGSRPELFFLSWPLFFAPYFLLPLLPNDCPRPRSTKLVTAYMGCRR